MTLLRPSPQTLPPPPLPPPPPREYYMCSQEECEERQSSGEISIFESQQQQEQASSSSSSRQSSSQSPRRIVNPYYAMTKYRRSAAGTTKTAPVRSIEQLTCCINQLEYILCYQQPPPPPPPPLPSSSGIKQTLTGTVSFIEDRVRAIQVDMVKSQTFCPNLQYRIVKIHILVLYLLCTDKASTHYETKFGQQALNTALTNYWEDNNNNNNNSNEDKDKYNNHDGDHNHDDEILALTALQQLCRYYQSITLEETVSMQREGDGTQLSFVLDYYRRNVTVGRNNKKNNNTIKDYPKFQWVLQLLQFAVMGCHRSILRKLIELDSSTSSSTTCNRSSNENDNNNNNSNNCHTTSTATPDNWEDNDDTDTEDDNTNRNTNNNTTNNNNISSSFATLCRCCMAPVVDKIRFLIVEQYNKSYAKGEKVAYKEIARLLYFTNSKQASLFAIHQAGLTSTAASTSCGSTTSNVNDEEHDMIVFKVGPTIWNNNDNNNENSIRQDEFVFGKHCHWTSNTTAATANANKQSSLTAWDDDVDDNNNNPSSNNNDKTTTKYYEDGDRIDKEGVHIPPPMLLYQILKND